MRRHHHPKLALLFISLAASASACGDGGPLDPGSDDPPAVMLLDDGGTEVHMTSILSEAGMTVVDGGPYQDFVGDGLGDVDVVVLPNAIDWNLGLRPEGEAALVGYVLQGGGLFTIEWVNYNEYPIVPAVLPTVYGHDYFYETEEYSIAVQDEVTEGLPSTFMPGPDHTQVLLDPKPGTATWITGSESGPVLVGWSTPGRVISWNGAAEYNGPEVWTEDLDRMVVNAIRYAGNGPLDFQPGTTSMITLEASELDVTFDGDDTDGAGDFRFSVRLSIEVNGVEHELSAREDVLRSGSDGELVPVDVDVDATLPDLDGVEVTAWISYYEEDPTGPQAPAEEEVAFTYDAAAACWAPESSMVCVSHGETRAGDLVLHDAVGDPLDVSLEWTFGVR